MLVMPWARMSAKVSASHSGSVRIFVYMPKQTPSGSASLKGYTRTVRGSEATGLPDTSTVTVPAYSPGPASSGT